MKFKKWVVKFNEVHLPIGDLARDIMNDDAFPESNDYDAMLDYLENIHASDQAIQTFENAFAYFKLELGPQ